MTGQKTKGVLCLVPAALYEHGVDKSRVFQKGWLGTFDFATDHSLHVMYAVVPEVVLRNLIRAIPEDDEVGAGLRSELAIFLPEVRK